MYCMKYGDLFSGIGCVAQALKTLDIPFSYEFACDIDKHCKKNLLHNFDVKQFYDDVKDITELPKVDLFTAGFPCQPFSVVNRSNARGINHPKYDLFIETIRCLKLCDPDIWILENVAGLTYKNNRDYFNYIKKTLDDLEGWNWDYRILNSKDYGSSQSRNRIYFIGCKTKKPEYPTKSPILMPLHKIFDTSLPLSPFISEAKNQRWWDIDENTVYIDNGQSAGKFGRFYKLDSIEYCYTLTTLSNYVYMKRNNECFRRKFSIDECRLLQNIHPDFENVCSDAQFYRQIGNGMDVSMMAKLIKLNV